MNILDVEPLRRDLERSQADLEAARLARVACDETDQAVVVRADEAVRLARRNRDLADGIYERGKLQAKKEAESKYFRIGSIRSLRVSGNNRELLRLTVSIFDRRVSIDVTYDQCRELIDVITHALSDADALKGDVDGGDQ